MTEPLLDTELLKTLREEIYGPEGTEDFKDLLITYVSNGEKILQQIPEALIRNDRAEALRLAHSLKGASASIGANPMSAASRAMELTLKGVENPDANLQEQLEKMKAVFAETRAALQKYLQA